jgi:hypothetical protein
MYNPSAELAEIIVESERRPDAEPLHERKAGAIREAESLVRILTEEGPCFFLIRLSHSNDGSGSLTQQADSKLQGLLVPKPHTKERDGFMDDHITGYEESIRGLHVL